MHKYKFYELKEIPKDKPLPEDVNQLAEQTAETYIGEDLKKTYQLHREKKFFGNIISYKIFEVLGSKLPIDAMTAEFRGGIIQRLKLKKATDKMTIVEGIILNDKVSFKKKPKKVKKVCPMPLHIGQAFNQT